MSARSSKRSFVNSRKNPLGWSLVVLIHAVALYLLITGTAKKGLQLISKPLTAVVIQEVIIPPPVPPLPKEIPKQIPTQPKAPEMPFVAAPEVAPPVSLPAPTIAAVPTPPPVAQTTLIPVPSAPAIAPTQPKGLTENQDISIVCPVQVKPKMPMRAIREGTEGVVKAQIRVQGGQVIEVTILSGPRVFHAAVTEAIMQYKCKSDNDSAKAVATFIFKLE
jgi:protein TonB